MKSVAALICGAGHIGESIAAVLSEAGAFVTIVDREPHRLDVLGERLGVRTAVVDISQPAALTKAMDGHQIVVNACPFFLNVPIATAAAHAGLHYFDLSEDVATTKVIRDLAKKATTAFVPQCGLAPGFIGIVGHHLARSFDRLETLNMRVGALPRYPTNGLKYNLTWSTDGLINEYCNPCEVVRDGHKSSALPLEGLESFTLDGEVYEAFNTSGGLGTLCETWDGAVQQMSYKTIRYPGHCELMRILLQDLGLRNDRGTFKRLLEASVPETGQDVVIVFVNAVGEKRGRLVQEAFLTKVFGDLDRSAIQATTAGGMCAMIELFADEKLPQSGFVRQEDAPLEQFLDTRFGRIFKGEQAKPLEAPRGIAS